MHGKKFFAVFAAAVLLPLCLASGCARPGGDNGAYVSEYRAQTANAAEALEAANALNEEIVGEGMVLLKNRNGALPLEKGAKITVLGKNASDPIYGGGGSASGADGSGQGGVKYYDLYDSLENAGFAVNPVTRAFYEDDAASGSGRDGGSGTGQVATLTGETPLSAYTREVVESYKDYNDAAIIFIARAGGEGADLKTDYAAPAEGRSRYNYGGDPALGDHYLEPDDNEEALIEHAKANFGTVVAVLNTAAAFEAGKLEYDDGVDGVLWLGFAGGSGMNALGKALCGEVNPSGRTADIYAADFKKDPTFANFGSNYACSYLKADGSPSGVNFVEYDEGIYVGYRYYETRAYEERATDPEWYGDNVVYPFGYGLSYTAFEWEVNFVADGLEADGEVTVQVKVTNTGGVAGKDVVQLYYSAPYVRGQTEKAHVVLGGYKKTGLIAPGGSDTVTITMPVRGMASYDHSDADGDGHTGYELDAGVYTLYAGRNSHAWAEEDAFKAAYLLDEEINYDADDATGAEIENRFGYMSDYFDDRAESTFAGHSRTMTRADFAGTFPVPAAEGEIIISEEEEAGFTYSEPTPESDAGKPWYTDEMPRQAEVTGGDVLAADMTGLDYDDPAWERFMDQLSLKDMRDLVVSGFFITEDIPAIGLPMSVTPDGPTGFVQGSGANAVQGTCCYASPVVVASTWNAGLARAMGAAVGEEGIWGGSDGVAGGYNGWYAPGANIHRSPFSGRNFEYYSEDPLLSGTMCAEVAEGVQSKGVFVMVKHFALNDQETARADLATWADEQTVREIYLKAFEYPVKAGAYGVMSAFNRMGNTWAGASYELLTGVLREERGFEGLVITDWANWNMFMDGARMVRAGCDLWLGNHPENKDNRTNDDILGISAAECTPTHVAAIRRAAKNIIYVVVNSNAMNRLEERYSSGFDASSLALGSFARGEKVAFDASSDVWSGYRYVLTGAPDGVTIDGDGGRISGAISPSAAAGEYVMTVSLKDERGFVGQSVRLTLTVRDEDAPTGCGAGGGTGGFAALAAAICLIVFGKRKK